MKKIIIVLLIIAFGLLIYLFISSNNVDSKISKFELFGKNEYTIYEGESFSDPGFIILDKDNNDINSEVSVKSDLNTDKPGIYTITYKYGNFLFNRTLKRTINVLEDKFKEFNFSIIGGNVTITEEDYYTDLGFECKFKVNNSDCSNYVTVDDTDIANKPGNYEIRYILSYNGNKKVLKRFVNVIPTPYFVELSNDKPTNQDITITFTSNLDDFSHMVGPDNKKTTDNKIEYKVYSNGFYSFSIFDSNNNEFNKIIEINNIDKEPPNINECTIKDSKFIINSNEDIFKIVSGNNTYKIDDPITELNGNAKLYDEAGNYTEHYCKTMYPEKTYSSLSGLKRENKNSKISYKMYKYSTYMVTTIWVEDILNQYHTGIYALGEVARPSKILEKAINTYNMKNDIIVGINGSGFIVNGTFGQSFYNLNHAYNKSAQTPYVLERGKLIRDLSAYVPKNQTVMGFDKNGIMKFYTFNKANNNASINKAVVDAMKNDRIKDTIGFGPILLENGKVMTSDTANNLRQGFCQVDNNNYIIVTNTTTTRSSGFNFKKLATYFQGLGCKNAYNFDGGGSISLLVHENGKTTKIFGDDRNDADIAYLNG